MIEAKILADSVNPVGCRLTTFELTYPRFVHAEVMTHRVFSRNAASSRAIPIEKMLKKIEDDPVIPMHWGKNQKGMQAYEEMDEEIGRECEWRWRAAMKDAVRWARELDDLGIHKQIVNRLVEPFMHITVILSGTDFKHFFNLRDHEAAEPHFQLLAKRMKEVYEGSIPNSLRIGDWHLPLIGFEGDEEIHWRDKIRVSAARCARVSYLTHDGKRDVQADIDLHDRLSSSGHWSPFEHPAVSMGDDGRYGNFQGFKQYRKFFQTEFVVG